MPTPHHDLDRLQAWIATERLGLADLFASLDERGLSTPTPCTGWTVREIAAHLTTTTRMSFSDAFRLMVKARGSFDRMIDIEARERVAAFSVPELVEQLRADATSRRRAPGSSPVDPLIDLLVHGQDVARPLGVARQMPLDAARVALDQVVRARFWRRYARLDGLRLVATDADWTFGAGTEVRAPLAELLLLATGRTTAQELSPRSGG